MDLEELLERTRVADPKLRKHAVRDLCPCELRHNLPQAWDRVLEMVDDPDLGVRRNVLHVLIDGSPRLRESDVVGAIERMRDDPEPRLRRQVRKLLARHRRTGKINQA